jgi:hypothetical protein
MAGFRYLPRSPTGHYLGEYVVAVPDWSERPATLLGSTRAAPAAYLVKPFTIAGLRATIESVLNTGPRGLPGRADAGVTRPSALAGSARGRRAGRNSRLLP